VSIHLVNVEHITHTCPGNPEPHVFDTRRTLVHTTPGGPCRTPVDIGEGCVIDCGRILPAHRQCPACRSVVVERTITTRHHGDTTAYPQGRDA